jgi:Fe-S cluster assembly ATP-binding protein
MAILTLRDLTVQVDGKPILDGLTLDLWEGHVHAIVGPNGAGKSTLAASIMGLEAYRSLVTGEILFAGERINDLRVDERARRGITLAWQEPARFEGLTVERFIGAVRRPQPASPEQTAASAGATSDQASEAAGTEDDGMIAGALHSAGLDPDRYLQRAVDQTLSGGERKKVEMASILAMRPRLVLLDEPDSGIDVASLEHIFGSLRQLRQSGATVVLITHSLAVLARAEHAFLMCCGRIVDKGDVDRIGDIFAKGCIPCEHGGRLDRVAAAIGEPGRPPGPPGEPGGPS